ncbi:hypothetical protein SADUNF_Sadunf13G0074900 [Salix dunnii]|uniref:Uncharacterized protein n=1 Tax=Salix dunnii TaxID=1413687 RepID=A0A835JL82_9ROSI|nr:hypothetical protein SADUNF_Sadunf13G0074900 [Salix dunnii]
MNSMVSSCVLCIYCLDVKNIIAGSVRSMLNLSKMMNKVDLLLYDQIYSSTTASMGLYVFSYFVFFLCNNGMIFSDEGSVLKIDSHGTFHFVLCTTGDNDLSPNQGCERELINGGRELPSVHSWIAKGVELAADSFIQAPLPTGTIPVFFLCRETRHMLNSMLPALSSICSSSFGETN